MSKRKAKPAAKDMIAVPSTHFWPYNQAITLGKEDRKSVMFLHASHDEAVRLAHELLTTAAQARVHSTFPHAELEIELEIEGTVGLGAGWSRAARAAEDELRADLREDEKRDAPTKRSPRQVRKRPRRT